MNTPALQFVRQGLPALLQLPAVNWIDRVRVVRENDHYVVADVEYANHWSLGSNATLLGMLTQQSRI